jgi:AraC-like DNA-binding protein/Tfp pilus assembly protein PilF
VKIIAVFFEDMSTCIIQKKIVSLQTMAKRLLLIFIFFSPVFALMTKGDPLFHSSSGDGVVSKYKHLSPQQLFDTARYYHSKNSIDTALICYSLLISGPKSTNLEHQERIVQAYNRAATIYHQYIRDYRTAYEYLIKALILSEQIGYEAFLSRIYHNIGNIYFRFNNYDLAKSHYVRALNLHADSVAIVATLSNLGSIELKSGNADSAFYLLNKGLPISRQHNDVFLHNLLSNIALYYETIKQYDSAFYYYNYSLSETEKHNDVEMKATNLSSLSKLFFKTNQTDSALHYINLSNAVAEKYNFLEVLADNYLTLSGIERSKGRLNTAFAYFERYTAMKDSAINIEIFGDINQLQRLYEVSKTNQEIEQLLIEQQIKERTIRYQKIIQYTIFTVLLLVCAILGFILSQKRKLDTAYKVLVEKNLEAIDSHQNLTETYQEKYKKSALIHDAQNELLDKILTVMDDVSIVCDTDFSINKLAELANSNQAYVSQVINNTLKKNFRTFINSYRMQEAQRLLSEPDATKYTIEGVALKVGFKSRSTFIAVFKETVGMSPNFYLKSMQKQHNS